MGKIGRSLVLGIAFRDIVTDKKESQEALSNLLHRLGKENRSRTKVPLGSSNRVQKSWLVAASLAFLVLSSSVLYWQFFYNPSLSLITDFGQQLTEELPDGSIVTLNAKSKLTFYKQQPRKVWLEGEAYFEIVKKPDTDEVFQVLTKDLQVKVVGTTFNVNTRNDETKVFLEEGSVFLDIAEEINIEMQPGDLIVYSHEQDLLQQHSKDASSLQTASWKDGTLIFKDKLLVEALYDIEDIYGIHFIVQTDALRTETITGGIPIKNLEVTLRTLTEVYGLQMNTAGKRYFITGRN